MHDVIEPGDKVFVRLGEGFLWTTVAAILLTDGPPRYVVPGVAEPLDRESILTEDEFNALN